jgi:GNAT superfamily N-acetyltransferase
MSPQRGAAGAPAAKLVIRAARMGDCAALARLSTELGYSSSQEEVERRLSPLLDHAEHAVFVAEGEDDKAETPSGRSKVAGWVHGFVKRTIERDPTVEIGGLIVDEAWRGRGVGRMLMSYVERWACERGCETVTVKSQIVREGAHAFYRSLGYTLSKSQHVFRKRVAPPTP